MSSSTASKLPITPSEYLEGELASEVRHEYVNGQIYAMAGASARHNEIAGEAYSLIRNHLRAGNCRTFIESVKVELADESGFSYYYPDVFVSCEKRDGDSHIMREPKLIIEILSPTTSRHDKGEKLEAYKRIPSVEEIVYIEQDWPEIFITRRSDQWNKHIYTQLDSEVHLESIALRLKVSEFYLSNPFPDDVARPWYLTNRQDG